MRVMYIPKKRVKTTFGESEILVPRDREASINPIIVPKRANKVDGIENVIVSLYAKGMSNSDIENKLEKFIILTYPIQPYPE